MAARYPKGLPARYRDHWARPWTEKARKSLGFRRWLKRNGYLTPHFPTAEAKCKDGTPVPRHLSYGARQHAFQLEKFRHACGDKRLDVLSWYRTPAWNRKVGGASKSQHMTARATDFSRETVERIGRRRFFQVADVIFSNGGVGSYPAGSAHLDSRGFRARWRSY